MEKKIMFKFEEYPEIKKAHELSRKWDKKAYQAEFECERSGGSIDKSKKWQGVIDNGMAFDDNVYPSVVFKTFNNIKPSLTKVKTGEIFTWDEIFEGKSFEELDNKLRKTLYMLVEYERPYRLPAEYYDNRDRIQEIIKGTF